MESNISSLIDLHTHTHMLTSNIMQPNGYRHLHIQLMNMQSLLLLCDYFSCCRFVIVFLILALKCLDICAEQTQNVGMLHILKVKSGYFKTATLREALVNCRQECRNIQKMCSETVERREFFHG